MRAIVRTTALGLAVALLGGCATAQRSATLDDIERALQPPAAAEQPATPPPADVTAALLPPIELPIPGQSHADVEPRFDVKVHRSPARSFFMGLVEGTPYNMTVHPGVEGQITLDLKNVTIPQVMDAVRRVYGYDFERTGSGFFVLPNAMRTRLFRVNYLAVERSGVSRVNVSSGQVSETRGGEDSAAEDDSGGERVSASGSRIDTRTSSAFWQELAGALQAIVGAGEGRSVVVTPQSGLVVVRAMPEELRAVEEYLEATQVIVRRQVILEAKILEVQLNDGFQSGINWAALGRPGDDTVTIGQIGGGSIFGSSGTSSIGGNTGDLDPANYNPILGTATSAFGGVFTAALNFNDFNAFIELLKTQGEVQVLSSPRVSTVNNQKAVIKVGTDEFFVTDVESSTNLTTGTASTQNNVELTPFFSGVALDVVPQIDEDGAIILHIHPTVSEVREQVKNISVSSTTALSVPLANSSIRESDSIIHATNGQVVVIGGLMQNTTERDDASVPLLGDIPVLGQLFRHRRSATRKSELVILLRPVVIENGRQWAAALDESRKAIRALTAAEPAGGPR